MLDERDISRIARAVASALEPTLAQTTRSEDEGLVDASTAARLLGVSTGWVYAHADELGAVKLGSGPKPRLRFDLSVIYRTETPESLRAGVIDRRPRVEGVDLLPVGGAS